MASSALRELGLDWCKKEDFRPIHSILLSSKLNTVPVGNNFLSLALGSVLPSVENFSRKDDKEHNRTLLLLDFAVPVSSLGLGPEIRLDLGVSQVVFSLTRLDDSASQSQRVSIRELRESGAIDAWRSNQATNSQNYAMFSNPSSPSPNSPTTTPSAYPTSSDFPQAFARCSLAANYRKLRCFSGLPSPARDEDPYLTWIDHVEGQMDEWQDLDDGEKRKRIREALRPPSLNIVNDLRHDDPAATALDYLKALDVAFGDTSSDDELFINFHSMRQKEGDSPSKFLTSLQDCLRRAIRRGVIPHEKANKVRLSQFIKGILFDEMLLVNLHLRDQLDRPPSFLTLLSRVRKQEEETLAKQTSRRQTAPLPLPAQFLQHAVQPHNERHQQQPKPRQNHHQEDDKGTLLDFCFGCGEVGHIRRRCPNPSSPDAVNQKLIRFILSGQSGNGRGRQQRGSQVSYKSQQTPM